MKKKLTVKRVLLTLLCLVLVLVLALAVVVAVYLNRYLSRLSSLENDVPTVPPEEALMQRETDPVEPEFTGEEIKPEDVVWETRPMPPIPQYDEIYNILLVGQDRRPGQKRQRSDAMILCTINLDKKTLIMTSFQRDTYVQYPRGYRDHRLNSAYTWGGPDLLNETLTLNYGIQIDGNVEVDFESFIRLIDLFGGVQINLTNAEAASLNMNNKEGWSLHPGLQTLDGAQALAYSRIRKIDSDFGRTNRQRKVLLSMLESCKTASLPTLLELLETILTQKLVVTNLSEQEIMSLAMDILPILRELSITTQFIPAEGTYTRARVDGMSVLIPDLEANRKILEETLLGDRIH